MIATVKDIEIRGHEVKHSTKTDKDYIIVRFEDETGAAQELVDRDMERAKPLQTKRLSIALQCPPHTIKYTHKGVLPYDYSSRVCQRARMLTSGGL